MVIALATAHVGNSHSTRKAGLFYFVAAALGSGGCGWDDSGSPAADARSALFTEVTSQVGLEDAPERWPVGTHSLPEITGGGVAVLDYDNDGDLDILQIRNPPPGEPDAPAPNRLFQQQPDGTFLDVTAASGVGDPGYGQGVAVGDADNDGDLDVYVTNFGRDAFYRNNGDGTFIDATAAAGLSGEYWSTSATFVDYDRDGDLDLYVVHYLQFDPTRPCSGTDDVPEYCGPNVFEAEADALYRNNGDGSFTDVTAVAGMTSPGKGLGVVAADLTRDGWVDIYVANDGEVNQLWVNRGDGTFVDEAIIRGVSVNAFGKAEASMGVTTGDVDGDGQLDLFMTHLRDETNTLYSASRHALFTDNSHRAGFAMIDLPYTGFGCGFFDYDHDGDLDLAIANGRVKRGPGQQGAAAGTFWNRYAERNLLLRNAGNGRFSDVSTLAARFGSSIEVSRGLAFGDIDNDGDIDLVVGNLTGIRVFRNDAPPPEAHWLLVRALAGNRDAIGAEVTVVARSRRILRLVLPGFGYASSNDPRVHFGLGETAAVDALEVAWPDGRRERFSVPDVDRELTVRQGQGEAL